MAASAGNAEVCSAAEIAHNGQSQMALRLSSDMR